MLQSKNMTCPIYDRTFKRGVPCSKCPFQICIFQVYLIHQGEEIIKQLCCWSLCEKEKAQWRERWGEYLR
jgi:hypothetical protein